MAVRVTETATDQPFVVQLESFSGPLDLLLHLLREQEIDIADIPIASIADQFLGVIDELGLNEAAEYLEMAARLLRIKIQMLLPRPLDDDEWAQVHWVREDGYSTNAESPAPAGSSLLRR